MKIPFSQTHSGLALIALFFLVLLLTGNPALSETVGLPVKVTSSNQDGATMAIPRWKGFVLPTDPNRMWLAVADWGAQANHLVYTTNGGTTWNLPGILLPNDYALDYHVSVAGDAAGNLYTVFPYGNQIQLRRVKYPAQSSADLDPLRIVHTGVSQPRANVMIQPGNQRLWVFTRESYVPSQNVRYYYSDNAGQTWASGTADPTNANEVRIGSMPYVNGQPALVVLYLNNSLGFKYYLWNGTQFEARPDAQIYSGNIGYDRAFTHNVVAGDNFHLVFGSGDTLYHYWKKYNNGTGAWQRDVVDYSPYTQGNDWEVASTVRGDELFVLYRKSLSADTTRGQIFCRKWAQSSQSWYPAQQVSTLAENVNNHWPNTVMQVPSTATAIPIFWYTHLGTNDEQVYFNEIQLPPPGPCCLGTRGNVDGYGIVDLSDLSILSSYLMGMGTYLPCPDAANVNGTGIVDISDLSYLVAYLTGGGVALPVCP
ncbi:hypothetical protein C3F09_00955 [candidate division GN15 bacterium]|uniref:Dockerin domain-containing protein n=1 Tax=candidate division GN15 bacterium TaxID=2072418 RepID=A0A855X7K5_9BACT|nr:MAG: hypothetical protein C3F09_00955 [candidate division GN15 bacterium]